MINYVKSGDQLITIDQSKVISTDMIMMLDKQISKEGIYIHDDTKLILPSIVLGAGSFAFVGEKFWLHS